ncbi:MAG: hypothetical protein BJ554DRAFT_3125 [Olpidium bornovanus]|uniref:Uncharacterized protein n=1 Tax=Olpidium bornovanus TaxID=278681 RepID=A0A8H7ZPQ6_9FUNG|nr:MAG: hypothetical protein BJ554DRAFT_3125 [Olpidium bornovanus]
MARAFLRGGGSLSRRARPRARRRGGGGAQGRPRSRANSDQPDAPPLGRVREEGQKEACGHERLRTWVTARSSTAAVLRALPPAGDTHGAPLTMSPTQITQGGAGDDELSLPKGIPGTDFSFRPAANLKTGPDPACPCCLRVVVARAARRASAAVDLLQIRTSLTENPAWSGKCVAARPTIEATTQKLIQEFLPSDITCPKETRDLIVECCVGMELICFWHWVVCKLDVLRACLSRRHCDQEQVASVLSSGVYDCRALSFL